MLLIKLFTPRALSFIVSLEDKTLAKGTVACHFLFDKKKIGLLGQAIDEIPVLKQVKCLIKALEF